MSWNILRQIARTGIRTEPAPAHAGGMLADVAAIHDDLLRLLGRALAIRQVDAGSCNGCELEITALGNPYYNIEGLGIKFVASPRHADMLLVTGPVSRHMETALRRPTMLHLNPSWWWRWAIALATVAFLARAMPAPGRFRM